MNKIIVPSELNAPGKGGILLVGRDPGREEEQLGRPFVGEAGHVLDGALEVAGLAREEVNITNLVSTRPANNEFKNHSVTDVEQGLAELRSLIAGLQPRLVIALGNEAAWATVPDYPGDSPFQASGIMDRRGYFHLRSDGVWVLPTLHPANVKYKVMPSAMLLELDFERARVWLEGELPRQPLPPIKIAREEGDLEGLVDSKYLSVDIETKWGVTETLCIGFCGDDFKPVVVPDTLLPFAFDLLATEIPKILHHGMFDIYKLEWLDGYPINGELHDTMYQHWALYPELAAKEDTGGEWSERKKASKMTRKGLAFLASMYGNWEWWKNYPEPSDPEYRAKMFRLNGIDCFATRFFFDLQMKELKKEGVVEQYLDAMQQVPIALKMQSRGMRVDNELRLERMRQLQDRLKENEDRVVEVGLEYVTEQAISQYVHQKSCECCHGRLPSPQGKLSNPRRKTAMCWSCAGFEKAPSKRDLLGWFEDKEVTHLKLGQGQLSKNVPVDKAKKALLEETVLGPCTKCDGIGYTEWIEFNPFSAKQLADLIYEHIGVPKTLIKKKQVDEEAVGAILHWARG